MDQRNIHIGWDGTCREHGAPSIARPTEQTVSVLHKRIGKRSFAQVYEIHCATGHRYLAVDVDELIDDPFSELEEAAILETEDRS